MRIVYNRTAGILSDAARMRLQNICSESTPTKSLEGMFPHHSVSIRYGRLQVTKADGSVIVDILQDGKAQASWVESAVNLRMTLR